MLHYAAKDWHIGDIHPYFENGTLYLFYLKPNGILRCDACFEDPEKVVTNASRLAVTKNYSDWVDYPLPTIILNIVKLEDTYYCCQGTGENSFYESRDLINWEPSSKYRFVLDTGLFPAGARDYACFWDYDRKGIRVTMNAYFTNQHNEIGSGLDCCVGISDVIEENSPDAPEQRVLLPLDNSGRELMKCMEPECNQVISMGGRWYLVTSLARQTVHWVGAPSYWIGEKDTPIDSQDWWKKKEYRLDGEDLCAAQIAENNGKYYLFGWIPLNYNGQEWGGHLNLPREVYPLENGLLASRLDPEFAQNIIGRKTVCDICDKSAGELGYHIDTEEVLENFGVKVGLQLSDGTRAGIVVDAAEGTAVLIDILTRRLRIVQLSDGQAVFEYSAIDIDVCQEAELHVVFDEDIVEAFLNDRYSLCARVKRTGKKASVYSFSSTSGGIKSMESYFLKKPDPII